MGRLHRAREGRFAEAARRALLLAVVVGGSIWAVGARAQQIFDPLFTGTPATTVAQGTVYRYPVVILDLDLLDTITITAPTLPSWLTLTDNGNRTALLTGTPTGADVGAHPVVLRASDGQNATDQGFTVTVIAVNVPPLITGQNGPLATRAGTSLTITLANLNVSDPDDTYPADFTLSVRDGANYSRTGNTITPSVTFAGTLSVPVTVNDGTLDSNVFGLSVQVAAANQAPVAAADAYTTAEDAVLNVNAPNGVLANDSDADNDDLTATLVSNATSGMLTLNANGSFRYAPPQNFSGSATFTYRASDGTAASNVATVTITVTAANDPPSITSTPPTSVDENSAYTYTIAASDPDGDALTFAAPSLPAWLTFTPPATITGTPARSNVGTHNVTVTVSDGIAATVAQTFQIGVRAIDAAPAVTAIPMQTATEITPFMLDLAQFVSDSDTAANGLVYSAGDPLPSWLSLSSAGLLSGTPPLAVNAGDVTIRFNVADAVNRVPGQFRLAVRRVGRADLGVEIAATPSAVALNTAATWTVTITNHTAQVDVGGVSLEARFAGVPLRLDQPATSGCAVTPVGNETQVDCTLGALAGGATATVQITGSGSFAGDVYAVAEVAISGTIPIDNSPDNDRATGSLSIAQNLSTTPAQSIAGIDARAAAAADFNGDGYDDVVLATADGTVVLLNVVDAANPAKRVLATLPITLDDRPANDVAIADLNGDQALDVVTASGSGTPNRVLLNSGNLTFAPDALGNSSAESRAVVIADVNGDLLPDIVFANRGASTVYTNRGSGNFSRAAVGDHDARGAVLVDLFGDPLPELVLANAGGDAAVYRNNGGAFELELTLPTGPTTSVAAADFNGDGAVDLVFGRATAAPPALPSNLVWLNSSAGRGSFFLAAELGAAATARVLIGDFDLDGDIDILAINTGGSHQIYANAGGVFALHAEQVASSGALGAAPGKLSADDKVDVILVGAGGAAVFYNDGKGNLGLGDTLGPTIELRGEAEVRLTVATEYVDAGATAVDQTDGDVTSRLVVNNPVDTAVLGSYTVTYQATDLSGNPATPVTRIVHVQAREGTGGGGGGAIGAELAWLALWALAAALQRTRRLAALDAFR